ncbi:MAG: 30S ribosomal protein S20 [bacterium]
MPNKKSAKKELRKSIKRQVVKKGIVKDLKDMTKKSKKAIDAKKGEAQELVAKTIKTIDKAAKKGAIKKNTASRKKSRLQKKLNKAGK